MQDDRRMLHAVYRVGMCAAIHLDIFYAPCLYTSHMTCDCGVFCCAGVCEHQGIPTQGMF